MNNVIQCAIGAHKRGVTVTRPAWLYDYGMKLKIVGLELPTAYEVDFAHSKTETATRMVGDADGVDIPNALFESGTQILAWLYVHEDLNDGYTVYEIKIPLLQRPHVDGAEPTPAQQDAIDVAIAALNNAIEITSADVVESDANAERAENAAEAAEASATAASSSETNVRNYANQAAQSAQAAQSSAGTAQAQAQASASSAQAAAGSASSAAGSATAAETAKTQAESEKEAAQTARTGAERAETNAGSSASAAANSAYAAATAAGNAAGSAAQAAQSASFASGFANNAQDSATAAAGSASAAAGSASSAASANTAAQQAKTGAESARDRAEIAAQTLVLDSTLSSPTQAAQAQAVGNAVAKVQNIIDTDYAPLNEYSVAVSTSAKYGSNGVKFEKGKVYKIHVTASGWTASSSGTYALVLRTTNIMVGNSTEWDENVIETILYVPKTDLDVSGNVNVVKDFVPSQNALYLSYYVRGGQSTTCTMSVDVLSGEQASKKTELNNAVQLPRNLFYRNTVYNGETYASNTSYAASKELYFPEAAWIESASASIKVYFLDSGATGYSNRVLIPPGSRVIVNISAKASTRGTAIDNIKVYTTADGKTALENSWRFRLSDTTRTRGSDRQFGGLYVADADERGLSHAYGSYQNNVTYPYIFVADKDLTIYLTRYYRTTGYIVSPNGGTLIASLEQEKRYTIPAGTKFLITLLCEYSGEATTQLGANLVFAVADEDENLSPATLPFNTTVSAARIDTAFCDSNGTFYYISGEDKNDVYYVVENGSVTATNSFDGPTGHANSCCYRNGLLYISPWTTKNKLYVYTVDETEKTLTYSREITIPVAEEEGATEYYVCDDEEKQIISMGMRSSNTLMKFTLWVKHESTYVEARSILIPMMDEQAGWIQSFTVCGKYVIYIMGHEDYTHLGYGILDTTTGILKVIPTTSDTASVEIEALIPVEKNLFIAVSNAGKQYAQYIRLE